jgi:hypothetical protein
MYDESPSYDDPESYYIQYEHGHFLLYCTASDDALGAYTTAREAQLEIDRRIGGRHYDD